MFGEEGLLMQIIGRWKTEKGEAIFSLSPYKIVSFHGIFLILSLLTT